MIEWITSHRVEIVRMTLEHILLCSIALSIAIVVAIPLGVWAHGHRQRMTLVTVVTGLLYTIPSIALFALLVPIVGLGTVPVVAGLVTYAQLMLIRAVVDGLDSVPADAREAAIGMGIDRFTILRTVDMPLALPVFISGVRVATVTVIGIATIGAVVDAGGLGSLILQGIQRNQTVMVMTGAILVSMLALGADRALVLLERRARPWASA